MKKYLFIATALAALASCSSDEFVGDNTSPTANNTPGAIQFTSNAPRITRATAADYAKDLDYSFYVYATKTVGSTTSNVFAHNPYSASATTNTPYVVWWQQGTANKTSSNTYDWEYVGAQSEQGTSGHTVTPSGVQTIKYWDYSADNYIFTAYKNNKVGTTNPAAGTVTNVTTAGFTFEGTAAQFAGLYVADKLTITNKDNEAYHGKKENEIGDVVVFTFRSGATKVRLGIYETIPGYQVRNVNFRPNDGEFTATKDKALLSGSFNDNNDNTTTTATAKYNIIYNSTSGIAEFNNTASSESLSKYFDFGTFAEEDVALKETSADPTWASGSSAYQDVFPNTDHVDDMILYVDYELYNTTTQEVITVKGAKAVVPEMYMTWNPNYAYTYLFKISDNTNGTSGTEGTSPAGLFPITFDAVTIAVSDNVEGIITTLSAPAITTFQDGSVSTEGITYANANGPIYITVNTNGTLADLTNIVKLYTVKEGTTEADLMLLTDGSTYNKTEVASDADDKLTVLDAAIPVGDITFAAGTTATFTPIDGKTYAFEYSKGVTYVAATGTYVSGTTYYTDATGATEVDTTGFTAGTTDVSQYFVKSPAVKAYKVIKIKEASNSGSSGSGDGGSRSF